MQVTDLGHSAKSAGGRLQLNTHAPYVCGFAWSDTNLVHGCIRRTCTKIAAVSHGTSQIALLVHHFGANSYERIPSLIQNHMQKQCSESAREWRIALYKVVNAIYTVINGCLHSCTYSTSASIHTHARIVVSVLWPHICIHEVLSGIMFLHGRLQNSIYWLRLFWKCTL